MVRRQRQMRMARNGGIVVVVVAVVLVLVNVIGGSGSKKKSAAKTDTTVPKAGVVDCRFDAKPPTPKKLSWNSAPAMTIDPSKTYTATIETTCGTMEATLDAQTAPVATNNFVFLAQQGFYDGLAWHRVVKDFVVQGGDPKGDGSGGPGYTVKGEVPTGPAGAYYPLGSLAAAKTGSDPDGTMGSQFFVVTGSQGVALPNQYARFGRVTTGLNVAQRMESYAPDAAGGGQPTKKLYILKVTISESAANTTTSAPAASTPSTAAPTSSTAKP